MNVSIAADQHTYLQLANILRNQIFYGEIQEKVPSSREIAERFGVNFKTANKAIDILVQEGIVKRVKGKGTFLTSPVKKTKSDTLIGLILSDVMNPNFALLAESIQKEAHGKNFSIVINTNNGDLSVLKRIVSSYQRSGVQALIIQGGAIRDPESKEYLRSVSLPVIGDHTHLYIIDEVWIDVRAGAQLAVQHLLEVTSPPIAFISGSSEEIQFTGRYQGYRDALLSCGIIPDFRFIRKTTPTFVGGYQATLDMIREGYLPRGIFYYNLVMSLGGIHALLSQGIKVPEDVAVVGCDDSVPVEEMIIPTSTVAFSYEEEARNLLFLIERRLSNPEAPYWNIRIPPRLLIRKSSKPG